MVFFPLARHYSLRCSLRHPSSAVRGRRRRNPRPSSSPLLVIPAFQQRSWSNRNPAPCFALLLFKEQSFHSTFGPASLFAAASCLHSPGPPQSEPPSGVFT